MGYWDPGGLTEMKFRILAAALLSMAATSAAQAATTIASAFTRVTPVEAITAPFTSGAGVTSTGTYTGFVEVRVSGTGYSAGSTINDAFYFTASQASLAGNYYHLGLGTTAQPFVMPNPTLGIERFMSFIDNVGAVPVNSIPAFAANNTYSFVIDLGALSSKLTLGVLDGNFGDNGGQYNISLWQLRQGAGAVPEAGTWVMMIVGFGAAGVAMRRRRGFAAIA
jgi:PEP-CTERM motif